MSDACEVPFVELLRSVPKDSRVIVDEFPISSSYPVGPYCHRSADTIEAMTAVGIRQEQIIMDLTAERDSLILAEEGAKLAFEHLVQEKHEIARSETSLRRSLEIALEQNRALRAERDALREDAERLDWIECRAMNGQIQIAQSIMRTGYEIAVLEKDGSGVTVNLGTLRKALDSARKDAQP